MSVCLSEINLKTSSKVHLGVTEAGVTGLALAQKPDANKHLGHGDERVEEGEGALHLGGGLQREHDLDEYGSLQAADTGQGQDLRDLDKAGPQSCHLESRNQTDPSGSSKGLQSSCLHVKLKSNNF